MRRKFWRGLLALALSLAALLPSPWAPSARAVTQADIDSMEDNLAGLAGQITQLEDRLAQVRSDKARALEQKALLDEQIALTDQQIALTDQQIAQFDQIIADYDLLIAGKQAEIVALEDKQAAQYELFCKRVRSMEEQGAVSYLSILFNAASFSELLDNVMVIGEIMDYDNGVIDMLQATRKGVQDAKADLENQQAEQEELRAQQEVIRAEQEAARSRLEERRAEAAALVAQILDQESEYRTALAQIEEEEERVQAEILRLSRELEAQNQAAAGGYIWPVSSRKVTSPFGGRNTGIPGASTDHKGVDIGGVGWNTQVCAAKAGTVIVSAKVNSYGNYVVVSHGNGNTTLYAHMSSRKVSVGQVVAQGDVLGVTGDTGVSRGPHLHFEITENGVRVDPLQYLTGYERCW